MAKGPKPTKPKKTATKTGSRAAKKVTEDPVVRALHDLTSAVAALTEEVRALRDARPLLPEAPVAATRAAPPPPAQQAAAASLPAAPDAPAGRSETLAVVAALFDAAATDDEGAGFQAFCALVHSQNLPTKRAIEALRGREWASFRRNLPTYLSVPTDPQSHEIVRWHPEEPGPDDEQVKVFVHSSARMPVPLTVRRDPAAGGALKVSTLGL